MKIKHLKSNAGFTPHLLKTARSAKYFKSLKGAGFTLIELLIYISIFAVAAGMLSGILVIFTRIQGQEAASSEVTQQLSFVQTTIQRLVREAVNIQNQAGPDYASSTLILRMASSSLDPTVISSDSNAIYLKQGTGPTISLTSDRVKISQFQAVKYENPGGHAIVQVDLGLTYNSPRLYQQITRNLKTAIGRVTAATFDDNLLPNQDNAFSIGIQPNNRWKTLSLSNLLYLGTLGADPAGQNGAFYYNTTSNVFRGYQNGVWTSFLGAGAQAGIQAGAATTNASGVLTVTFATSFTSTPIVVVSAYIDDNIVITITSRSSTSFSVKSLFAQTSAMRPNIPFTWMAILPTQ